MKQKQLMSDALLRAAAAVVVTGITTTVATATEPCGDLGECKALIEMNTTDGDIGFHFLMDGDDLIKGEVRNPDGKRIFKSEASRELREQFFTETFVESAEPFCTEELAAAEGEEDFVTLVDFLERWAAGTYVFTGKGDEGEESTGETTLTHELPAAPRELMIDAKGVISWDAGDDLGECATKEDLDDLVTDGVLTVHPEDVPVAAWEVVFEPDVEDGDPRGNLVFSIRVPGDIKKKKVKLPKAYLSSLPDDTPAKIEVGAIGEGDNATFTEIFDICINEDIGCEEE